MKEAISAIRWRFFKDLNNCVQPELTLKFIWWRCNYINYGTQNVQNLNVLSWFQEHSLKSHKINIDFEEL